VTEPAPRWDDATRLLDALFDFRSRVTADDGERVYRAQPNGLPLHIRRAGSGVQVKVGDNAFITVTDLEELENQARALDVRQMFRDFLIHSDKQEKTAVEYTRHIERLSQHSRVDIFLITRANDLVPLVKRYDSGGADYDEGNVYNGGPRAAIKQYLNFLQSGALARAAQPLTTNSQAQAMTKATEAPPLNQILYGPPGTGKTHRTIDEALAILDPDFLDANRDDRTKLRTRFKELEASEHVRFVTFHQSFSYEDFVEGLRAEPDEATRQLKFLPVDGVFKAICDAATTKVVVDQVPDIDVSGNTIWKMSLGNRNEENYVYEECIAQSHVLLGWGSGIDFSGVRDKRDIIEAFREKGFNYTTADYPVIAVNAFVVGMQVGDLVVVSDGNYKFRAIGQITGDYAHLPREQEDDEFSQSRAVRWLKVFDPSSPCSAIMSNNFIMKAIYRLGPDAIDREKLRELLSTRASDVQARKSPDARVLIIDEINRGNISRIFGELITLIEPSKRAGRPEALSVTLPYSKRPFNVPDNLYLIGTMNTSDRSLSGLDIALRRRFVFKEMPPRPELLAGVDIQGIPVDKLLEIMNRRIEALLDREHCLGHAYFLPLTDDRSIARLARIFSEQILPLLKEYFFEDWDRIRWVLNDHRKQPVNCFVLPSSSSVAALFGDDFEGRVQDKAWTINEDAFDRVEAYLGILDSKAVPKQVAPAASDGSVEYGGYRLERLADTTIKVYDKGVEQVAMPILKHLATQLGISHFNSNGGVHNTRQLGAIVIKAAQRAAI
jgi:5-methylcytosine-specific restriction protein B